MARGYGHALASNAEHICDEVVGHDKLIGRQLVVVYEQPTAKLLLHAVEPVADSCLGDLRHQRLRIPEQNILENPASFEFCPKSVGPHSDGAARTLDDCSIGRGVSAHKQGDPNEPVVAGDTDLGCVAVLHDVKERNDRRSGEINVRHPVA